MLTGQNFILGRGEQFKLRFIVAGAAGATSAEWHMAANEAAMISAHDLDLSSQDGGITLTDAPGGVDAYADLHFTAVATEALPVGKRFHELWVTLGGETKRRATGKVTVQDTLKS